jgi:outer membrane protein assembly factor BamB
VAAAPGKAARAFDVTKLLSVSSRPFEVVFAAMAEGRLIVALAYNGYAKDSGGKNGYVASFDADTGQVEWSSGPLVANHTNFHVAGDSIVTGYGFTAEPDFLFVLDRKTGAIDARIPLKSGPDAIVAKGDQLFVRTYDTDYVFRARGGFPPTPASGLTVGGPSEPANADAEQRCWLRAATMAIDRRDPKALDVALAGFAALTRDLPLYDALDAAKRDLQDRAVGRGKWDITGPAPVVVPAPCWGAMVAAPPSPPPSARPLQLAHVGTASPTRGDGSFRGRFPGGKVFLAPVDNGILPGGERDVPVDYGTETLRARIPGPVGKEILVYGGRYVVVASSGKAERVLDADALRHPPDPDPTWKQFAEQDVTDAELQEGTLFVCNGGGSYAREVKGKKGFMTALDLATGQIRWRSEPLVCAGTFVSLGDYFVTGYGFTDEPDYVFVLRRSDGKIMQRLPVDSMPFRFSVEGARVEVDTYAQHHSFEVMK